MPTVKVNGINLYYELRGQGEPLVLITGFASDISELEALLSPLSQTYKVLAFDNRGAGRSDKPDEQYSIEMMAEDTVQLMDAVGIERADVLGISMGGRIALELALRHPEKVKKLVLVSTAARVSPNRWRARVLDASSRLPVFRGKYPQPHYAFVRQRQASSVYDASDRLARLETPTLILHGRRDRIARYELAEEMHDRIKDSTVLAFPGGHLFFLLGSLVGFLKAVKDFLGREGT